MELKTRELLEAGIKEGIVNMGVNMGMLPAKKKKRKQRKSKIIKQKKTKIKK